MRDVRLQQANDDTNMMARSYYNKFSIQEYVVNNGRGRTTQSQFKVAIEHKTPKLLTGKKQVEINFYNLLFTASLRVSAKDNTCHGDPVSVVGFVELVKTDITWYKGINNITGYRQSDPEDNNQYVITKLSPDKRLIFADSTAWVRTVVNPTDKERIVPLKYESTENIVVDFDKHKDTTQYERLIEKKIFLVQTDFYNKVLDVIAGADVLMYLDMKTYNFTDAPHLDINTNHSLIRRITAPWKYAELLTKLDLKAIRQEPNHPENVPWSGTNTLNPIPKGIHIYTE